MEPDRFERVNERTTWLVGGLYSVESQPGYRVANDQGVRVVKILALDSEAVHLRLYRESFPARPDAIDSSHLSLGTMHDLEGHGIGHLPLKPETFSCWRPVFLRESGVRPEELEGYAIYKTVGGQPWE